MLVGHSEGGMVAVERRPRRRAHPASSTSPTSSPPARRSGCTVGRVARPRAGARAGERPRRRAAPRRAAPTPTGPTSPPSSSDRGDGTVAGDHDLSGAYVPVAGDVQASARPLDPRLPHRRATATSAATAVQTHTYQITRELLSADRTACPRRTRSSNDRAMLGLMQDVPLTTNWIFAAASSTSATSEIVTRTATGHRAHARSPTCWPTTPAGSPAYLDALGVSPDGRVGTFAWNTRAPPRAVLRDPGHRPGHAHAQHPLLPRAADLHRSTTPRTRWSSSTGRCCRCSASTCRELDDRAARRRDGRRRRRRAARRPAHRAVRRRGRRRRAEVDFTDRVTDERQAAAICYTTGTTGNPKGVALLPPLDVAALERGDHRRAAFALQRPRPRAAGRPDVPRQRVGSAVRVRAWPARRW